MHRVVRPSTESIMADQFRTRRRAVKLPTTCLRFLAAILLAWSARLLANEISRNWTLDGFVRPPNAQPIITPRPESTFRETPASPPVHWEALHTFNPAAIVRAGKIYVLYRAEDDSGEN